MDSGNQATPREFDERERCAHGCGNDATVEHADGRMLCLHCYENETGDPDPSVACPTCGDYEAYLREAVGRVEV